MDRRGFLQRLGLVAVGSSMVGWTRSLEGVHYPNTCSFVVTNLRYGDVAVMMMPDGTPVWPLKDADGSGALFDIPSEHIGQKVCLRVRSVGTLQYEFAGPITGDDSPHPIIRIADQIHA